MTSQLKVDRISPANGSEIIIDGFEAGSVGKILQVASEVFPMEAYATSGDYVDSGLGVSITPSSVNSKVMFILNGGAFNAGGDRTLNTKIYRNEKPLDGTGTFNQYTGAGQSTYSITFVDSPDTSSEVRYQMYLQVSGGSVYYSQYDGTGKAINVIAMEIGE